MQHEMRAIEELVFVTKLSFVPAHKDKAQGFRATLSCALCRWYDSCGKGQEQAVQLSRERTTLLACLQELRKRLEENHGNCAEALTKKAAADAQAAADVICGCSWLFALEAHCLEGRAVHCAAGSRYKATGHAGSRVGC